MNYLEIIAKRIRKQLTYGLFLVVICLKTDVVLAQEGSPKNQDSLRITYGLNLSMTYKEGRLNQLMIPVGGNASVGNKKYKLELYANYLYHKINGFELENEILTRTVLTLSPNKKIHPLGGMIYETSKLYQVKYRVSPGVGIGGHIIRNEKHKLLIHLFGSYDRTEFINASGYETFRANSILMGSNQIVKDKLDLNYRIFYFQSIQDKSNMVFRFQPKLVFKITNSIAFTYNLDYRYESIVDPLNMNVNLFMTAGIQLSSPKKSKSKS